MTNSTILSLCAAILLGTGSANALPRIPQFPGKRTTETRTLTFKKAQKQEAKKANATRAAKAAALWRAESQKTFGWNGEEWEIEDTYSIKYDVAGKPVEQTIVDWQGMAVRETMTWNDNGMLTSRISEGADAPEGPFSENQRLYRTYDPIVTDYITFNDQSVWTGSEWIPSNAYKQEVTRNDDGNVTQMVRSVYYDGVYDPITRMEVSYGDDGKATKIEEYNLDYDFDSDDFFWVLSYALGNIVWENTDGQILDIDNLFEGANRVKSADVYDSDLEAKLTVEYTGENYMARMTFFDPEEEDDVDSRLYFQELDPQELEAQFDAVGPHGWEYLTVTNYSYMGDPYWTDSTDEKYIYDANDLILQEKVEYSDGTYAELESLIQGEITYDAEHHYPLTWTIQEFDYDSEEMFNTFRAEFSDYVDASQSGLCRVPAAGDAEPVYYNLQGQRIANPGSGLYIEVRGSESRKVNIR